MSNIDDVLARIHRDDLIAFALELCNIDSAIGYEREVGEHLYTWMRKEGLSPRKIGLQAHRFNVLGRLLGTGGGFSLIFNSHMDTAVPRTPDLVHVDYAERRHHAAWVDGDLLVGEGIINDKGPMAAFLIATKAIKDSKYPLPGDVLVSAVINETGGEPCDDEPGAYEQSKELGTRFLVTHGAVADYALVAEGTGFGIVWVEAGEFWYKVTLRTERGPFYTPYVPTRTTLAESPNMIVASAAAIDAIEKWAASYQSRNIYSSPAGTIVPKAQIGAIRGGDPNRPLFSPQICELYLDVRSVPNQDPLRVQQELSAALTATGLTASVELFSYRPAFVAQNIDRLLEAVRRAHRMAFGEEPQPAPVEMSSTWHDRTAFSEVGIPALTYGPRSRALGGRRALSIDSLYQAALVYARIAVDVCSQRKE
jgi:acetylornithine deacetylase/succinyl-diaminopimelate desuccinylase-like protein